MKKNFDNLYEKLGCTYREKNGHLIPDITLPKQTDYQIGKYGWVHLDYMARHHDDLLKTMTDEQKEIFEKFDDCWSEYMSLAEAAIFEYAFKLGMHIAIETLTE